tara:strand:- start:9209 stop:9811 length:603 start_codon:yes stop_codon:yes gene_type:complete
MAKKTFLLVAFLISNFLLSATFLSNAAWAKDHAYQGKIEGMVCAFCAYNVSKKISHLPGIDADSINVDLKSGRINFLSSSPIEKATVSKVFADSGFGLVEFFKIANSDLNSVSFLSDPLLTLYFLTSQIEQLTPILDTIGSLATMQTSRLSIKAPKANEIELLKPILAGRKNVIKVLFTPVEDNVIELKLFRAELLADKH